MQVLPADVLWRVIPEQPAVHHDEPAGRGADDRAPVGEREQAALDRVRLQLLAGNQQRLERREGAGKSGLGGRGGVSHGGNLERLGREHQIRTERTERTERDKLAGSRLSLSVLSVFSVLSVSPPTLSL